MALDPDHFHAENEAFSTVNHFQLAAELPQLETKIANFK
jgi:hypothetical protein